MGSASSTGQSSEHSYPHQPQQGFTDPQAGPPFQYPSHVPTAPVSGHTQEAPPPYTQQQVLYPRLQDTDWQPYPTQHGGSEGLNQHDVARDVVLSRVMAAEEFLQHMVETDSRIQVMSEVADPHSVLHPLTEALGLRGHMQDELLRILSMLTADNSDLSCLNEFEDDYPEVVFRLRDLGNKAKALKALSSGHHVDLDPELADLDPSLRMAIETHLQEVDIVAAQTDIYPEPSQIVVDTATDGELLIKHQVEEQTVSSDFAERVLAAGPGSVDHLLQEHALRMQALRNRQNNERHRARTARGRDRDGDRQPTSHSASHAPSYVASYATSQTSQTSQPLAKKSYVAQINFGQNGTMSVVTPGDEAENQTEPSGREKKKRPVGTATVIRQEGVTSGFTSGGKEDLIKKAASPADYLDLDSDTELEDLIISASRSESRVNADLYGADEFQFDDCLEAETEDLRSTFTKDMWEKRENMTSDDFKSILADFRTQEEERARMRHAEKDQHQSSMLAKLAENQGRKNSEKISEDDADPLEEVIEGEKWDKVNPDTIEGFIRDRDQEDEEAKRIRGGERQRMNNKLKDKLKNKTRTAVESLNDLTADIDQAVESKDAAFVASLKRRGMSDVDIDELLRRHLLEAEQIRNKKFAEKSRLDERLREILGNKNKKDLEQLDDDVVKELASLDVDLGRMVRGRRSVSAEDLEELLREHRRQQEAVLQSRAAQKGRADDKLKAKLLAARELKDGRPAHEAVRDDQFFARLQGLQYDGDMSHDAFQDMLRQYLNDVDGKRNNEALQQRRRLRAEEKLRERETQEAAEHTASTLVTEHQEKTKQLQNTRQRERRVLDDKLKEKLKRNKIQKQAEDDPYDF